MTTQLIGEFERGLAAPICLTWELTYACNLACVHCLSSSGVRDDRELDTTHWKQFIDEMRDMQIFYVNIGGGEPTIRPDFWEIIEYTVGQGIGVKFSTNGSRIDAQRAAQLAAMDYVDVQVSLDGATAEVNDRVRGRGSFDKAITALRNLAQAGFQDPKVSVVVTRENVHQLDAFAALARSVGGTLRLTRFRPSGRGADTWEALHPTNEQQRYLYEWLTAAEDPILTGDSFFHLSALGDPLDGLNMCGAGKVVCLIDPIGDVYACPFAIHEEFLAGNIRDEGGFTRVWRESAKFQSMRETQPGGSCTSCSAFDRCRGGCMAAKFFTGLSMDDPDPECVFGHGEAALAMRQVPGRRPSADHSKTRRAPTFVPLDVLTSRACDANPVGRP